MIYLWVEDEGWKQFDIDDVDELEKRKILIGIRAWIGDGARIGARAHIGDGESPIIIFIVGSQDPLSSWGEDRIDIGCKSLSILEWENQALNIGKEKNFTDAQIEEYINYIEFIKTIHYKNKQYRGYSDYAKFKIESEIKRLEENPEGDYTTRISALEWALRIIA